MFHQKHIGFFITRAAVILWLSAGLVVLTAGCQQAPTSIEPAMQTTSARRYFTSDEEALREGLEGYGTYLAVSDEITASGGLDPQRIAPYVSENLLPSFVSGYESLHAKGLHSQGATAYDSERLQSWTTEGGSGALVSFYLCIDVEQVRLLDNAGNDVTPIGRASRVPMLATIEVGHSMPSAVLTENEPWTGASFC